MRLNLNKYIAVTVALLCFSNMSFAGTVQNCTVGNDKDFGDATQSSKGGTYGQACHETNAWQQLGDAGLGRDLQGDTGGTDDSLSKNIGWNSGSDQSDDLNGSSEDIGDNGVSWRVADANGNFTGAYGQPELTQGQDVQFKFTVTRSDEGNHLFDRLKVWVDWNGLGGFNNDAFGTTGSEILGQRDWAKNENADDALDGMTGSENSTYSNQIHSKNSSVTSRNYIMETTIPMSAIVGDTWMRARIVCSNSLNNYSVDMNLLATGYQDQGEVEDYKVTINARPPTPVPEPTTLLVFGTALIGLVLSRKKAK
jgi:hypothetical protein